MNYTMPAEWEPHVAVWVAWPSHADLWGEGDLAGVQKEFIDLCRAITYAPPGATPERLKVLFAEGRGDEARQALAGLPADFYDIEFGDIWLRDTAPVFLVNGKDMAAGLFQFNGWGGKYDLPDDMTVGPRIAAATGIRRLEFPWILEGGSVEVDGEGTCLTTEECLLNSNRNSSFERAEIENKLRHALGVEKILWLRKGLLNDHPDGHVDTVARFTAPGEVVCMLPNGADDPNTNVLKDIRAALETFTDARGRKLKVHTIPSPGLVTKDGRAQPASYVNFYISNHAVAVPTYGSASDAAAVQAISRLFPGRKTFGLSASVLLGGGGAFHCITQQEPKPGAHHAK